MSPRLLAGVLVLLALASGCGNPTHLLTGGNDVQDYCSALKGDQKQFAEMMESPSALVSSLPMLDDLADKAPDDLTDEWQTFTTAVKGLRDALHDAGVKPSEYVDGKAPAGLGVADIKAISDAADELSSQATVDAANGIDDQARDVCKLNLGI